GQVHVTQSRLLLKKGPQEWGQNQATHDAASVGDCRPVWPKTPWRAPPRAARHPAAAGVSAIRILLFSILRAGAIACRRATVGRDSHRPWDGRPPYPRWTRPPPPRAGSPCQKYTGLKIPKVQGFAIALLAKASQAIPFSRRRSLWQR